MSGSETTDQQFALLRTYFPRRLGRQEFLDTLKRLGLAGQKREERLLEGGWRPAQGLEGVRKFLGGHRGQGQC